MALLPQYIHSYKTYFIDTLVSVNKVTINLDQTKNKFVKSSATRYSDDATSRTRCQYQTGISSAVPNGLDGSEAHLDPPIVDMLKQTRGKKMLSKFVTKPLNLTKLMILYLQHVFLFTGSATEWCSYISNVCVGATGLMSVLLVFFRHLTN